jgi:hypothetical protein
MSPSDNETASKSISILLKDDISAKDIFELLNSLSLDQLVFTLNQVGYIDSDVNYYRQKIIGEVTEKISRKIYLRNLSSKRAAPAYITADTFIIELNRIANHFNVLLKDASMNSSLKLRKVGELQSEIIGLLASQVVFDKENGDKAFRMYRRLSDVVTNYLERRKFQGLLSERGGAHHSVPTLN